MASTGIQQGFYVPTGRFSIKGDVEVGIDQRNWQNNWPFLGNTEAVMGDIDTHSQNAYMPSGIVDGEFRNGPNSNDDESLFMHSNPSAPQGYSYKSLPAPSASAMSLPPQMQPRLANNITWYSYNHNETNGVVATPPTLASHGLFRVLQSNGKPHPLTGLYADLSGPPDLFRCLHKEQAAPQLEDMNSSDPEMVPYEQELRFENDLYTPRWVRGHGNKREGWCGICKPGRWLNLKNSAFWYNKSFLHGISAATGTPFQEPLDSRRMNGNPDIWEGLCGSCNEWVPLVSSKKKGTTWFRHAYKCHTYQKVKDARKCRRE